MYFIEEPFKEEDVLSLFQEMITDPENNDLRTLIIDPIIAVLEKPIGRNRYIEFGNMFLEANSEMLSKEFPTKAVSFPKGYVDGIFEMFDFDMKKFKDDLKDLLKKYSDKSNFMTITATPSNVIHAIALFYSDMTLNLMLRDSARQQMGLTVYHLVFNHFFHPPHPTEPIMAYTYSTLDKRWGLVVSENVINWIGTTIDTAYAFHKTEMSLDMSVAVLVRFLNRVRTSFQQNLRLLANKYYENLEEGNTNKVGADVDDNQEYLETTNTTKYRDNLIRKIKSGDGLYTTRSSLYEGIARRKNVKTDSLYEFAQKIDHKDIAVIIDTIFYVFIVKEGNSINDINSSKYIARITNFPTAIDRAIAGKPIIQPLVKKYNADDNIVKAYICLIATYILMRINDIKS